MATRAAPPPVDPRNVGFLVGVLAVAGHFGGDGVTPQITLKMHTRHERLFRWLERTLPGGRLYGPYEYGQRRFFQWMVRGAYLREVIAPVIAANRDLLDDHVAERFDEMCRRYHIDVGAGPANGTLGVVPRTDSG